MMKNILVFILLNFLTTSHAAAQTPPDLTNFDTGKAEMPILGSSAARVPAITRMDSSNFDYEESGGMNSIGAIKNLPGVFEDKNLQPFEPNKEFVSYMHAPRQVEVLNKTLESFTALYMVALLQTEPAIASGLNNASVYGHQSLDRYLGSFKEYQQELNRKGSATSRVALDSLYGCLEKEMTNPATIPPITRAEALVICTGDEVVVTNPTTPLAANTDDIKNHRYFKLVGTGGSPTPTCQKKPGTPADAFNAVDVLFCKLSYIEVDPTFGPNLIAQGFDGDFDTFAKSEYRRFYKYYGSAFWQSEKVGEKVTFKKKHGTTAAASSTSIEKERDILFKKYWIALLNVLTNYCNHVSDNRRGRPWEIRELETENYWKTTALTPPNKEFIDTLSTDQFPFKSRQADLLLKLMRTKSKTHKNNICTELDSKKSNPELVPADSPFKAEYMVYFHYAMYLANMELYSIFLNDLKFIKDVFQGEAEDDEVKVALVDSVYNAANVNDISLHLSYLNDEFMRFGNEVKQYIIELEKDDISHKRKEG